MTNIEKIWGIKDHLASPSSAIEDYRCNYDVNVEPHQPHQKLPHKTVVHLDNEGPRVSPPQDYMCYSIFVTLCCCWLVGIFAIIRSAECRAFNAVGDHVTARAKSRLARSLAHVALGLGIVLCVAYILIVFLPEMRRTLDNKYNMNSPSPIQPVH